MHVPEEILDDLENGPELAYANRTLALWLISIGLGVCRTRVRGERRREIKAETPKPEVQRPTAANPRPFAKFPDSATAKMSRMTTEFLGTLNGWKIGRRFLGELTKPEVLVEIEKERRSGDGHYANMRWYEAVVEPMTKPNQTVGDFWKKYKGPKPHPPASEAAERASI